MHASAIFNWLLTFVPSIFACLKIAASAFAYAYKLFAEFHKADPFCSAVPITSSIQYAMGAAERKGSALHSYNCNNADLRQSEELPPQVSSQPWCKYSQRVSTATDGRLFGFCLLWRLTTTFSHWMFWRLLVGTEWNSWATRSIENRHEALATKYRCVGLYKQKTCDHY